MTIKLHGIRRVAIDGDFIRLDSLLKLSSLVSTGGEAKLMIQNGEVLVNSAICTMRGKKIKPGDIVLYGGNTLVVKQPI